VKVAGSAGLGVVLGHGLALPFESRLQLQVTEATVLQPLEFATLAQVRASLAISPSTNCAEKYPVLLQACCTTSGRTTA